MKKRVFKSFFFVFAVSVLITLFVFSGSAKTVKKNGFSFDIGEKSVTVVSYTGKAKKVKIPKKVNSLPVTKIKNECFWQVRTMTSLSIPDSVTEIGESAFNECTGLTKLILPKKLKKIDSSAFWYCTNLKTVVLDSKVARIGKDAFRGCANVTVYVVSGTGAEAHVKKLGTVKYAYTYPTALSAPKSLKLYIGKTRALKVTASPANTYYSELEYSSANKTASVSADGVVTATGCGKGSVTVSVKGMKGVSSKTKLTVLPGKPGSVTQNAKTQTSVTLKWKKAPGATGYRVSLYDAAKKKWIIHETDKQSYTVENLKRGENVTLRVRSFYKSGKTFLLGGYVTITTQTRSTAAVSGLKKTGSTVDGIFVSWNKLSKAVKYKVVLCAANGKALKTVVTEKTSCVLSVSSYNDTYKIKVCGVFKNGKETYDGKYAEIAAKALSPEKIGGLKASFVAATEATLSWNSLSGVDRYNIYKYDETKKAFVLVLNTKNASVSVASLAPETQHRFIVSPVYKQTDGKLFVAPGAAITVKTPALFVLPKTKAEVLSAFEKALNATAKQKDFMLFESVSVSEKRVTPDEDKLSPLLSAVDISAQNNYNFVGGMETGKKLTPEKLIPFLGGKFAFSPEDAEGLNVSVKADGSGYVIEISAAKLGAKSALPGSLLRVPNLEAAEKSQGVTFEAPEYKNLFVSAKINGGKLDTLSSSVELSAKGTKLLSSFAVSEKIGGEYIFLWN